MKMIIPSALQFTAERLMKSQGRVGTSLIFYKCNLLQLIGSYCNLSSKYFAIDYLIFWWNRIKNYMKGTFGN